MDEDDGMPGGSWAFVVSGTRAAESADLPTVFVEMRRIVQGKWHRGRNGAATGDAGAAGKKVFQKSTCVFVRCFMDVALRSPRAWLQSP
jgi:hypothetical protein